MLAGPRGPGVMNVFRGDLLTLRQQQDSVKAIQREVFVRRKCVWLSCPLNFCRDLVQIVHRFPTTSNVQVLSTAPSVGDVGTPVPTMMPFGRMSCGPFRRSWILSTLLAILKTRARPMMVDGAGRQP